MNKFLLTLLSNAPEIITTTTLILIELLGLGINAIAIYLFGLLYTSENYYKIFLLSIYVTTLVDAAHLHIMGTWALSFFVSAFFVELILTVLRYKKDLKGYSLRSSIILFIAIIMSAVMQEVVEKALSGQTLAVANIFSIVVCTVIFILIHSLNSSHTTRGYIKM